MNNIDIEELNTEEISTLQESIMYIDGVKDHSKLENLDYEHAGHTGFQPELISGQTIKTINGQSVLGNGNITIQELPSYPIFDASKEYALMLVPNQSGTAFELQWAELSIETSTRLITSDGFIFKTANNEKFIVKEAI